MILDFFLFDYHNFEFWHASTPQIELSSFFISPSYVVQWINHMRHALCSHLISFSHSTAKQLDSHNQSNYFSFLFICNFTFLNSLIDNYVLSSPFVNPYFLLQNSALTRNELKWRFCYLFKCVFLDMNFENLYLFWLHNSSKNPQQRLVFAMLFMPIDYLTHSIFSPHSRILHYLSLTIALPFLSPLNLLFTFPSLSMPTAFWAFFKFNIFAHSWKCLSIALFRFE